MAESGKVIVRARLPWWRPPRGGPWVVVTTWVRPDARLLLQALGLIFKGRRPHGRGWGRGLGAAVDAAIREVWARAPLSLEERAELLERAASEDRARSSGSGTASPPRAVRRRDGGAPPFTVG